MNNHEKIYEHLKEKPIESEIRFSDISDIANLILNNATGAGKRYAVLRFIQKYCNATLDGNSETIERGVDPRKVFDVDRLKKMRFTMRANVLEIQDENIKKVVPKEKIKSVKVNDIKGPKSHIYDDIDCCKKEYFGRETQEFMGWLLDALHKFPRFEHSWRARSTMGERLVLGDLWNCTSIFNAYENYAWRAKLKKYSVKWEGSNFEETDVCLTRLKKALEKAIKDGNGEECRMKCREIFEWGGVDGDVVSQTGNATRSGNVSPHIKEGIPVSELRDHLVFTRDLLNGLLRNGCDNANINFTDDAGNPLRVDSGTTKVYSLICENFVMYDGRVASGLGYLVRKWWECEHEGEPYDAIPCCLRFSCDKAKNKQTGRYYRNSNPCDLNNKRLNIFKSLGVNKRRVNENIQASWLLMELLEQDGKRALNIQSKFSRIGGLQKRLRALESAIFMIGYSLPITYL